MKNKKSKSGHFRSWSFSVIFKKSLVILSYSKYKYYLYYTIDDHFSPEMKMTGNDHDRIIILKKREYNMMRCELKCCVLVKYTLYV